MDTDWRSPSEWMLTFVSLKAFTCTQWAEGEETEAPEDCWQHLADSSGVSLKKRIAIQSILELKASEQGVLPNVKLKMFPALRIQPAGILQIVCLQRVVPL